MRKEKKKRKGGPVQVNGKHDAKKEKREGVCPKCMPAKSIQV
jgi:hypothetical protein